MPWYVVKYEVPPMREVRVQRVYAEGLLDADRKVRDEHKQKGVKVHVLSVQTDKNQGD